MEVEGGPCFDRLPFNIGHHRVGGYNQVALLDEFIILTLISKLQYNKNAYYHDLYPNKIYFS